MKSVWTLDALKQYIDERYRLSERALDKAHAALEARLEGMNEFRAQILSERGAYISKAEYDSRHTALEIQAETGDEKLAERMGRLESWQNKMLGALGFVVFLTPLLTGLVVWAVTRHHAP